MGGGTHEGDVLPRPISADCPPTWKQKAIVAVAHSILTVIYCMLRDRVPYREMGAGYFDTLDTARIERHHVHRLEQLGYTVVLQPKAAA